MKIIDCEKHGNVVRFFLGKDDLKEWWGDDWDDAPYEHNCGTVYDDYVSAIADFAFPVDYIVCEPCDDWRSNNTPYCRDDFIKKKAPCIVFKKKDENSWDDDTFPGIIGDARSTKIYFGDSYETLRDKDVPILIYYKDIVNVHVES